MGPDGVAVPETMDFRVVTRWSHHELWWSMQRGLISIQPGARTDSSISMLTVTTLSMSKNLPRSACSATARAPLCCVIGTEFICADGDGAAAGRVSEQLRIWPTILPGTPGANGVPLSQRCGR
jgi:hypothetical protein